MALKQRVNLFKCSKELPINCMTNVSSARMLTGENFKQLTIYFKPKPACALRLIMSYIYIYIWTAYS